MATCCEHSEHDPEAKSVAEAMEIILAASPPIRDQIAIPLEEGLGRVLAASVQAPMDVPAWPNSAMDGYALRAGDGDGPRKCVGSVFAGHPYLAPVTEGQCVRIMTGAVLPEGADTVIPQELANREGSQVRFHGEILSGANVRQPGEDLPMGNTALPGGTLLRPAHLGVLASLGISEIAVFRPLRVAFFSTGDELQPAGQPLGPGQIYDSNRLILQSMLRRLGTETVDLGCICDDPDRIRETLEKAGQMADMVITTGGVSVGDADHIASLLGQMGSVYLWKMNMKPGRPLAFGHLGQASFFGLPGNPVSTMVTFYQFVRPAILRRMGTLGPWTPPVFRLPLAAPLRKKPGRTDFQRGRLIAGENGWMVAPAGAQSSHILTGMAQAECFIVLPAESGSLPPGSLVDVQILEGLV